MYWVYILKCADGSLYTGWTTDVEKRLKAHNAGVGARYTRGRRPVRVVWVKRCSSRSKSLQLEWVIKRLSRQQKQELVLAYAMQIKKES